VLLIQLLGNSGSEQSANELPPLPFHSMGFRVKIISLPTADFDHAFGSQTAQEETTGIDSAGTIDFNWSYARDRSPMTGHDVALSIS
jgi:hypothetical protein